MGFLKDISNLNKMGKEMHKNSDTGARLGDMQAKMEQANASMAGMAARASSTTALHGTPATATVIAARQTGQYINMQPMVSIDLLVLMPGGMPSPVTITEVVAPLHLARLQAGSQLPVKVGTTPDDVMVDWLGVG